jgi:hypothetical protein
VAGPGHAGREAPAQRRNLGGATAPPMNTRPTGRESPWHPDWAAGRPSAALWLGLGGGRRRVHWGRGAGQGLHAGGSLSHLEDLRVPADDGCGHSSIFSFSPRPAPGNAPPRVSPTRSAWHSPPPHSLPPRPLDRPPPLGRLGGRPPRRSDAAGIVDDGARRPHRRCCDSRCLRATSPASGRPGRGARVRWRHPALVGKFFLKRRRESGVARTQQKRAALLIFNFSFFSALNFSPCSPRPKSRPQTPRPASCTTRSRLSMVESSSARRGDTGPWPF